MSGRTFGAPLHPFGRKQKVGDENRVQPPRKIRRRGTSSDPPEALRAVLSTSAGVGLVQGLGTCVHTSTAARHRHRHLTRTRRVCCWRWCAGVPPAVSAGTASVPSTSGVGPGSSKASVRVCGTHQRRHVIDTVTSHARAACAAGAGVQAYHQRCLQVLFHRRRASGSSKASVRTHNEDLVAWRRALRRLSESDGDDRVPVYRFDSVLHRRQARAQQNEESTHRPRRQSASRTRSSSRRAPT